MVLLPQEPEPLPYPISGCPKCPKKSTVGMVAVGCDLCTDVNNERLLLSIIKQRGRHSRRQHAVHQLQEALVGHMGIREEERNLQCQSYSRLTCTKVAPSPLALRQCMKSIAWWSIRQLFSRWQPFSLVPWMSLVRCLDSFVSWHGEGNALHNTARVV